jgi:hypothetical protein
MDVPSRPVDSLPANRHVDSERAHGQYDTLSLEDRRTAESLRRLTTACIGFMKLDGIT